MHYSRSRSPASLGEGRNNNYGKGMSYNYSSDLGLSSLASLNPSIQRIMNTDFGIPERSRSPLKDYGSSGSRISGLRSLTSPISSDLSPTLKRREGASSRDRSSGLRGGDMSYGLKTRNYFDYAATNTGLFTSYSSPIKHMKKPKRTDYSDYLRPVLTTRPMLKTGYVPRSRAEREESPEPIVRDRKLIKFRETSDDVLEKIRRRISWDLPEEISSPLIDKMKEVKETVEDKSTTHKKKSSSRRGSKDLISHSPASSPLSGSPRLSTSRRCSGDQSLDTHSEICRKSSKNKPLVEDANIGIYAKAPIPPPRKKSIGSGHKAEKRRKSSVEMLLSDEKTSNFSKIANEIRRSRESETSRMLAEAQSEMQKSIRQDDEAILTAANATSGVEDSDKVPLNVAELTSIEESTEPHNVQSRHRRRRETNTKTEEHQTDTQTRRRSRFRSRIATEAGETSHPSNQMHRKSIKYKVEGVPPRRKSKSSEMISESDITQNGIIPAVPDPESTKTLKEKRILPAETDDASNRKQIHFNKALDNNICKAHKDSQNELKFDFGDKTPKSKSDSRSVAGSQNDTPMKKTKVSNDNLSHDNVKHSENKSIKPETISAKSNNSYQNIISSKTPNQSNNVIESCTKVKPNEIISSNVPKSESNDLKSKTLQKNSEIDNKKEDFHKHKIYSKATENKCSSDIKIKNEHKLPEENILSKNLRPETKYSQNLSDEKLINSISRVNISDKESKVISSAVHKRTGVDTKIPELANTYSIGSKTDIKESNKLFEEKYKSDTKSLDNYFSSDETSATKTKERAEKIPSNIEITKVCQKLPKINQCTDNQSSKISKNAILKESVAVKKENVARTEGEKTQVNITNKTVESKEQEEIIVVCKLPPRKKSEPLNAVPKNFSEQNVTVSIKNSTVKNVDSRNEQSKNKSALNSHAVVPANQSISTSKIAFSDNVENVKDSSTELDVKVTHTVILKPKLQKSPDSKLSSTSQKAEKEIGVHEKLKPIPDVIKSTIRIDGSGNDVSDIVKSTLSKCEGKEIDKLAEKGDKNFPKVPTEEQSIADNQLKNLHKDKIALKIKDTEVASKTFLNKDSKVNQTKPAVIEENLSKTYIKPDVIQIATGTVERNYRKKSFNDKEISKSQNDGSIQNTDIEKSKETELLMSNSLMAKTNSYNSQVEKTNVEDKRKGNLYVEKKTISSNKNASPSLKMENVEQNNFRTDQVKVNAIENSQSLNKSENNTALSPNNAITKLYQNVSSTDIKSKEDKNESANKIPKNRYLPEENIKDLNKSESSLLDNNLDKNKSDLPYKKENKINKSEVTSEINSSINNIQDKSKTVSTIKCLGNKNTQMKNESSLNVQENISKHLPTDKKFSKFEDNEYISNIEKNKSEDKIKVSEQKNPNLEKIVHCDFESSSKYLRNKVDNGFETSTKISKDVKEDTNKTSSESSQIPQIKKRENINSGDFKEPTTESKLEKIIGSITVKPDNILPKECTRNDTKGDMENLKNKTNFTTNQNHKAKNITSAYKKSMTVPDVGALLQENLSQEKNIIPSFSAPKNKIELVSLSSGDVPVALNEDKFVLSDKIETKKLKAKCDGALNTSSKISNDSVNSELKTKHPNQKENSFQLPKINANHENDASRGSASLKDIINLTELDSFSSDKIQNTIKNNTSNFSITPSESSYQKTREIRNAQIVEENSGINENKYTISKKPEDKNLLAKLNDKPNVENKAESSITKNDSFVAKDKNILEKVSDISQNKTMPKICDPMENDEKPQNTQRTTENLVLPLVHDACINNTNQVSQNLQTSKNTELQQISGNVKTIVPVATAEVVKEDTLDSEENNKTGKGTTNEATSGPNTCKDSEVLSRNIKEVLNENDLDAKQPTLTQQKQISNEPKDKNSLSNANKSKAPKLPPVVQPFGRIGLFLLPKEPPSIAESSSSEEISSTDESSTSEESSSETDSESSGVEDSIIVNKKSNINGKSPDRDVKNRTNASIYSNSSNSTTCTTFSTSFDENFDSPAKAKVKIKQLRFRKYEIDDFVFLKLLGKGSFGKVLLAELKDSELYFAIKCMKKDVVLEDDDVESTMIERRVLALGTQHPYMCKLYCTFQTKSYLFFVMEYLNGGDLLFHIQESRRFEEKRAAFYGAEIVSALKFLHKRSIVYRDIKLDNVMLDEQGHIRLVDFGMCQCRIYREECMPSNFCGTPTYIAPEIVMGQTYNQSVDWWSFGVLLYEMLTGRSPFHGTDEDELFWCICNEEPHFPRFLSKEAIHILGLLLTKSPVKRLGMSSCPAGDIKDHAFFRSINWDMIEKKQVPPPFKPSVSSPSDTRNFDRSFTMDSATLSPVDNEVLESMDQEQFHGFSYTNPHITG